MAEELPRPSCGNCRHWQGGFVCAAYPEGIPFPIMSGAVSHEISREGDGGIVYERVDPAIRPFDGELGETEREESEAV